MMASLRQGFFDKACQGQIILQYRYSHMRSFSACLRIGEFPSSVACKWQRCKHLLCNVLRMRGAISGGKEKMRRAARRNFAFLDMTGERTRR